MTLQAPVSSDLEEHWISLLTEAQAAAYLQVGERTLREWRNTNKGPRFRRAGRHIRYRKAWLDDWIDGGSEDPRAPVSERAPARKGAFQSA